jgi:7-carboxy-7-deazaguanine synthase
VRFVTITGGEPLLQEGTGTLVNVLIERGFEVQVETSGALDTGQIHPGARVILDVKTPGSGESGRLSQEAVERLRPADEVKFVLVDRRDYEFARDMIASGEFPGGIPILLSPAHGALDPAELAAWMLEDRLPARLQLQIHKYIWGRDARGV